jgi:hypothetical protein
VGQVPIAAAVRSVRAQLSPGAVEKRAGADSVDVFHQESLRLSGYPIGWHYPGLGGGPGAVSEKARPATTVPGGRTLPILVRPRPTPFDSMTSVKSVAAHEVVQATYPRPVTEKDEIGMAVGKAIDDTLSRYSYEFAQSRHPTRTAMNRLAGETLDEELANADVQLTPDDRERQLAAISAVLQAFRQSEVMGLARPRSRLILINGRVGIYAQPDYWDGRDRFYEMKSYLARPLPPDVRLQLQLFQLAFPKFRAFLACFDRHAAPVVTTIEEIPALEPTVAEEVLRLALRVALDKGTEKVLEYVDNPTVRYSVTE